VADVPEQPLTRDWGGGRVTLGDLAERLGLARATVSHVMAGRADELRIAKRTQERVLQAARDMGYMPNVAAQAVARGRLASVGLIMPPAGQYLPLTLVTEAARVLRAHGMRLSITELPDEQLADSSFMSRVLHELSVDGLLMNVIEDVPEQMATLISANHIPSIWLNVKRPIDCVRPDDLAAGRAATERLLLAGHRRIAYVEFADEDHYSVVDRRDGYAQAMASAGLPARVVTFARRHLLHLRPDADTRLAQSCHLLRDADRPTAVVCYENVAAEPILLAAATLGLSVPQDLSLIAFHERLVNGSGQAVTTFVVPMYHVGARAADLLLRKLADPSRSFDPVIVPFDVLEGISIAAPTTRSP
jgi:LacI family transcriptional regulator